MRMKMDELVNIAKLAKLFLPRCLKIPAKPSPTIEVMTATKAVSFGKKKVRTIKERKK
ncbi:MAG: hypothetical protein RMH75_00885 [Archaeoglobaceae archaeon]|nr:hypothetical protein [Archaeoglobaceae archaeon]MDW7989214.1 hypothetical protein [Archaeoglobaceae archaeon]